jgi:nitrile hydratase subunit alpha
VSDQHSHDHEHEHDHETSAAISNRVKALVATLERRGLVTEAQIDATIATFLTQAQPANGFRAVARAWTDAGFKQRLLADATIAVGELGIDLSHWAPVKIRAVENTPDLHNVIVCTLCSCYPLSLLGPSPTWYKSEAYRSRVVRDPRGVLAEFGLQLPPTKDVRVWDSTSELRYIVVPERPAGTENLSEAELASMITTNGLIGTAVV